LKQRLVPRMLSQDMDELWKGTQFMTEKSGGSDVGNIATTALGGRTVRSDVDTFLSDSEDRFDVVFVDPPFLLDDAIVDGILGLVADRIDDGGTVIVHRRAGGRQPASDNLRLRDQRRYGDSELWLYQKEEG